MLPDLSFSVSIAVLDVPAWDYLMIVFGMFLIYWAVKFLVSLVTGG